MGVSGAKFGKGAYFSTTPQKIYGNKMTEWYAYVNKIFDIMYT
jgi:hypothetical protein